MSVTEARKHIFEIMKQIKEHLTLCTLTERGSTIGVIMPYELFMSWKHTVYLMQRYPGVLQDIEQSVQDMKISQYIALEDVLETEGYIVSDHAIKQYETSRIPHKHRKNKS